MELSKAKIANGQPKSFSLSLDGWTDKGMEPYMGIILRFIDKDTLKR